MEIRKRALRLGLMLAMMVSVIAVMGVTASAATPIDEIEITAEWDSSCSKLVNVESFTKGSRISNVEYAIGGSPVDSVKPGDKVNIAFTVSLDYDYEFGTTCKTVWNSSNQDAKIPMEIRKKRFVYSVIVPEPKDVYNVWVGNTQVMASNKNDVLNGGMVSYDPATKTLTLNNAKIDLWHKIDNKYYGIYSDGDLNIMLKGESTISRDEYEDYTGCCGMKAENITFGGNGSLEIGGADAYYDSYGIYANKNLTFKQNAKVYAASGKYQLASYSTEAIHCDGTVQILDEAYVSAVAYLTEKGKSIGINCKGMVYIKGGSAQFYGSSAAARTSLGYENIDLSQYVRPNSVAVSYSATAPQSNMMRWDRESPLVGGNDPYRYIGVGPNYDVPGATGTINVYDLWVGNTPVTSWNKDDILGNGTVSYDPATSTLTLNGAKIRGRKYTETKIPTNAQLTQIYSKKDLNVVLKGTNTICAEGPHNASYYGLRSEGSISFSGNGTLDVKSLYSTDKTSCCICASKDITFKDSVKVSTFSCAASYDSGNYTAGIFLGRELKIMDNAEVTAEADFRGNKSIGVFTSGDKISISGGKLLARGDTGAIYNPNFDKESLDLSGYTKGYGVLVSTEYKGENAQEWDGKSVISGKNTTYKYVSVGPGSTIPGGTETPVTPETPATPETPVTPETPATPETPVTPETPYVFPFVDVPETQWYYQWVKGANQMGLINGVDATHYKPDNNMTYAEAIKLAACMNQKYNTGSVTLTNGTVNWYDTYVDYCMKNGIISQNYASVINKNIDRQTYAAIFAKCLPSKALKAKNTIPDESIYDVNKTNENYNAIYTLYRAGIVNGNDSYGAFNPYSSIKRSEVAAILNRMMDESVRVGAPPLLGKYKS